MQPSRPVSHDAHVGVEGGGYLEAGQGPSDPALVRAMQGELKAIDCSHWPPLPQPSLDWGGSHDFVNERAVPAPTWSRLGRAPLDQVRRLSCNDRSSSYLCENLPCHDRQEHLVGRYVWHDDRRDDRLYDRYGRRGRDLHVIGLRDIHPIGRGDLEVVPGVVSRGAERQRGARCPVRPRWSHPVHAG